jgi:hypothetical protein
MVNAPLQLTQAAAEAIAIDVLKFLAGEPERFGRFLASTGIGPADLRAAAKQPLFLAGLLDHLAHNEADLLAFAKDSGRDPGLIVAARERLAGRTWESENP